MELIDKHKKKVLIWYRFIAEKSKILKILRSYRICEFSTKNNEAFGNGEYDIMICSPKSAGTGVDISSADVSIYINFFDSFPDLIQSYYRISKHGDKTQKYIYEILIDHSKIRQSYRKRKTKNKIYQDMYGNS